jgi:hypothetical protein
MFWQRSTRTEDSARTPAGADRNPTAVVFSGGKI